MKQLSRHTQVVSAASLALFCGSCVILWGMLFVLDNKTRQFEERVTLLATAKVEAEQLTSLERFVEETKNEREALSAFVLQDSAVIEFLSRIEQTADNGGLVASTKSVTTQAIAEGALFESLVIGIELSGLKEDVIDFISYLEHLPYQSRVENVLLTRTGDSARLWRAEMTLSITKSLPQ